MKLLLDENLPKRLKEDFQDHEVYTLSDLGWTGTKNGPLLELMISNGFNALLTFNKNLRHQQNFQKYTVTVFVLTATINTYQELKQLVPYITKHLNYAPMATGPIVIRHEASS